MVRKKTLAKRIERLFSSINSEYKSLALMCLSHNRPKDKWQLGAEALEYITTRKARLNSNIGHNIESYCQNVFIPSGIVNPVKAGYVLTKFGRDYASPIAQFALMYAANAGWSISQFLGEGGPKRRGSANAIRLFLEIKKAHDRERVVSKADLEKILGLSSASVLKQLRRFQRIRTFKREYQHQPPKEDKSISLIHYDSQSPAGKADIEYFWIIGRRPNGIDWSKPIYRKQKPLVRSMAEFLMQEVRPVSISEIHERVGPSSKAMLKRRKGVLNELERDGFLKRVYKWHPEDKHSEVGLSREGILFYDTFISPIILALENGSSAIDHIKARGENIFERNGKYAEHIIDDAVELYCCTKPNRRIPMEDKIDAVRKILARGAMTRVDVIAALEETLGNKVDVYKIERAMPELKKAKIKGKSNSVLYYLKS